MTLIKSYYINLTRRFDRRCKMENNFSSLGFVSNRFEAIDGSKINLNDEFLELFKNNKFNYRRGVMGAALSHINLWKQLVNDDCEYYLIFEDDVEFNPNFIDHLNIITSYLESNTLNIIFLGFHQDTNTQDKIEGDKILKHVNSKIKKIMWGGLFAYIIHKNFAKEVLIDIKKNGLTDPIDTYIMSYNMIYIYLPILVKSPCMTFYNCTDSDIQYDLLSIYDDWEFFQYKDSPGNDITWVKANTFEELKEYAENEPNCVAFNTYAWLKYDIINPNDFIIIPGINSKAHGIYVKKSKLNQINMGYDNDK